MESQEQNSVDTTNREKHLNRMKFAGTAATILGVAVFVYYIYSVGPDSVLQGIAGIGFGGFLIILSVYGLKLLTRAIAWKLAVYEPHSLDLKDTFPAVVIGEALSSVIPLGILISGTAKALAVRKRVPVVVGLASVATENLFYSLVTGLFIGIGAIAFIRQFALPTPFDVLIDAVIVVIFAALFVGILMVVRQWHWASAICDEVYERGVLTKILRNGRLHVRMFENLIYGFYRAHPKRFLPLCCLQILFHSLGVFEVWFVLTRIGGTLASFTGALYLETMSRLVTVVFKLVPFLIGIDEASAEFVVEALGIGVGMGVTLAIVRKGRVLVWALIGFVLILKRGLSLREVHEMRQAGFEARQKDGA